MIQILNSLPLLVLRPFTNARATNFATTKVSVTAKGWSPDRGLATDNRQSQPKPDLRRAGVNNRPRNVIIVTCLLVMAYMYPMIFKPLFGIGELGEF